MNIKFLPTSGAVVTLASTLFFHCCPALAGQHDIEKDNFTGAVFTSFSATATEERKAGFKFWLNDFDPEKRTMSLTIVTPFGVDCGDQGLEIKTHEGIVHSIRAGEMKLEVCFADVEVKHLVKGFSVRVPMRIKAPLVGSMDTRTLKPERYQKK